MVKSFEKVDDKVTSAVSTNLEIGVYTIYDCVLQQFAPPICIPVSKVNDYFTLMVNDCNSPYYNHECDYILNRIGTFIQETGEIQSKIIERICILDSFVDRNKRNLQTLVQTLNFLPQGYFKMPSEQKEAIQEKINEAVNKYVSDYVVPDLDITSEKIKCLESKIEDYEERLHVLNN